MADLAAILYAGLGWITDLIGLGDVIGAVILFLVGTPLALAVTLLVWINYFARLSVYGAA